MGVTRTTLLSGPAAVSYLGRTFWARDGVLVSPALELADVDSDAHGVLDSTVIDSPVAIRFTPSAAARDLVALYPHLDGSAGKSLFGAADVPLVITASNGVRLRFAAVALVQMPNLILGAVDEVAGPVSFLALPARGSAVGEAGRVVAFDTATLPAMPDSSPQLSDGYMLSWGDAPWAPLRARDGFRVSFALKTEPVLSDANGLLDLTLESLAVEVRFVPASPSGPAEMDVLDALYIEAASGRALSASARQLSILGDSLSLVLPEAAMVKASPAFAAEAGRVGEVAIAAGRAVLQTIEALAEVEA